MRMSRLWASTIVTLARIHSPASINGRIVHAWSMAELAAKLKPQLLTYTEDGRLEIDNNLAENALRGICVGCKNWLFAGADCGGERSAAMHSLIETATLNGINPQAWLKDVLDRISKGHPINRIDELLPWNLLKAD